MPPLLLSRLPLCTILKKKNTRWWHFIGESDITAVGQPWPIGWSIGLVTRGCGFEPRPRQELSMTEVRPLSKAPNPQLLPGRRSVGCPLLQVFVHLDGLKAEHKFHCWLYSV